MERAGAQQISRSLAAGYELAQKCRALPLSLELS
jgi:hypothetical protein